MPQTNKQTKNSQSFKKHAKSLRELTKFNIELKGDIEEILKDTRAWGDKVAQELVLGKINVYRKAKRMGEKFAREITD